MNMKDFQKVKDTVTREWVGQYAWDILTDYIRLPKTDEIRNMEQRIAELLKELCIEVVD